MNKRLLAVPALGALLTFGSVACSSDNTAQLNSWAQNVCDAAKDPIAKSQAALADTGKVSQDEAPADLQKRLGLDLGTLAASSQQLADAVDKAGAPKIDNGGSVQKDAVDELKQAAQGYQDVQKKLAALPSGDQARFADGLRSVGDQVQRLSQLSSEALKTLQSGALGTAITKQPGCRTGQAATPSAAPGTGTPVSGAPAANPTTPAANQSAASPGAAGQSPASPSAGSSASQNSTAPSPTAGAS